MISYLGVAELCLGLAFELRFRQLDADYGGQAFAHVVAAKISVVVLEKLVLAPVVVDRTRNRRPEAGQVGATVGGIDVVREAVYGLGERVVVLNGNFHLGSVNRSLDVNGLVNWTPMLIQVTDEGQDAAFEIERHLPVGPFVDERNLQALCQVGHLPESLGQRVEVVIE